MQDVTSFVKAQSPLSLGTSGAESKKGSSSKGEAKNLFSLLLAGLSATKAEIKLDATSSDVTTAPLKEEAKNAKENQKKAKSVDEHLLGDLLKVVESLKTNSPLPLLLTLKSGSTLEKIINNQTALKEFAEVKSINDLLSLSKKYNLGLEKLTFTKESVESLQKEFPALTKSSFFETLKEAISQTVEAQPAIEEITEAPKTINPLEKNLKKSEAVETPSVLKELMSKEPRIATAQEAVRNVVSKEEKTAEILPKATPKAIETAPLPKAIETAPLPKAIETAPLPKAIETAPLPKAIETAPLPKAIETIVVQKMILPAKEEAKDTKMDKKPLKQPIAAQTFFVETFDSDAEIKPVLPTRPNEPKIELATSHKSLIESVLQAIKPEKISSTEPSLEAEAIQIETNPSKSSVFLDSTKDESMDVAPLTNDAKVSLKQDAASKQVVSPKESLGQFANDLREKIEAYKPPIMKVELSLFPKSLGEVDVTLLARGNNLHVNITSSTNTMTLFTQNQAEFKNALVNMGFTNLEMNFSDQRGQEQQHNQHAKNNDTFFDELSESSDSELATIELVVPRYV